MRAVAVTKNGKIVGHLPRTILRMKLSCHSVGFSCLSPLRTLVSVEVGGYCYVDNVPRSGVY